jgi:hypothetical protein
VLRVEGGRRGAGPACMLADGERKKEINTVLSHKATVDCHWRALSRDDVRQALKCALALSSRRLPAGERRTEEASGLDEPM